MKQSGIVINNLRYKSCLTKTYGLNKLGKISENFIKSCLVLSPPPEIKILSVLTKFS